MVQHGKKCKSCSKGGRTLLPPDGPCPLTPANLSSTKAKAAPPSPAMVFKKEKEEPEEVNQGKVDDDKKGKKRKSTTK